MVAILPGSHEKLLEKLKSYNNVVVYVVDATCAGHIGDLRCSLSGQENIPISLMRYYIYQSWALLYPENTEILLADFRDVFFQSNPFKYKNNEWGPLKFQLVVFQEPHPNRVISRCGQNGAFIINCYGTDAFKTIGSNTISSSGVVLGSRNAIAAYVNHYILITIYNMKYIIIY